jgi:hypothetical protein
VLVVLRVVLFLALFFKQMMLGFERIGISGPGVGY